MEHPEILELEKFMSKLASITKCDLALGYRVDCEFSPSYLDLESEVQFLRNRKAINAPKVIRNIRSEFSQRECDLSSYFLSESKLGQPKYDKFLAAIRNLRYVPLTDGESLYAAVILINSEDFKHSNTEKNLQVLADAAVTMTKAKRQTKTLSSRSQTPSKNSFPKIQHELLSNISDAVVVFDNSFNIIKSNLEAHKLFHCSIEPDWHKANRLIKMHLVDIASDIFEAVYKYSLLKHADSQHWKKVRFVSDAFHDTLVDVMLFNIHVEDKVCFGLMIKEHRHVAIGEKEYLNALQRFNALTSVLPTAVLHIDAHRNCHYCNSAWLHLSGLSAIETENQGWLNCFDEGSIDRLLAEVEQSQRPFQTSPEQLQMISSDDKQHWLECSAASFYDHNGQHQGTIITLHDVSESRDYTSKLKNLAENDQLTGLKNRLSYSVSLESALARFPRHGMTALLLIDLDRFKYINDSYGHAAGDALLSEVSERMRCVVRSEDTVARLGGDEFAIILSDLNSSVIINKIAVDLIKSISTPFNYDGHLIQPSCSIGISVIEKSTRSSEQFQRRADIALYKAKERGRNQYCFYDEALEQDAKLVGRLESELTGKTKSYFTTVYQPQYDAVTHRMNGFEVLMRWKHPNYLNEETTDIIKKIEHSGLSYELSYFVFKEVLQAAETWKAKGIDLNHLDIGINISAKQLNMPQLPEAILKHFADSSINPENFTLEVTETSFIDDFESAKRNLTALQQAGFKVSLDDFGTGFSSLALLRKIPLNGIKIDRSFVTQLKDMKKDRDIVKGILQLCDSLKLDSVAEGVETEGVKNWLVDNGCNRHQGFYYAKPLSSKQLEKLLIKSQRDARISPRDEEVMNGENIVSLQANNRL